MSERIEHSEPAYHLYLGPEEIPVVSAAVRLFISDEARQGAIRHVAREVLAQLEVAPNEQGRLIMPLDARQMKITHSAVKLLFDDLQREQADERETLRGVLDKLPDEHTMRAITLE